MRSARFRTSGTASIALLGAVTTVAMVLAMRGSAWPPALFFVAGLILPPALARLLLHLRLRRFPRLAGLAIALAALWVVAWIGKHPSAETAFRDITGVNLPREAKVIQVHRGWFDGRITAVRFRTDRDALRRTILEIDALHGAGSDQRTLDAAQWRSAVAWLVLVCPQYETPLPWTAPRRCSWNYLQRTARERIALGRRDGRSFDVACE